MQPFKHFIILDDDPFSRLLNDLAVIHSGKDLQFNTFSDPQDCLTYMRITPPNPSQPVCVLLDIRMPKLNGWEFLKEMESFPKELQQHYTVVMVTSSTDDEDLVRVQDHPLVAGYITKPMKPERLQDLLDHLALRATG